MVRIEFSDLADRYTTDELKSINSALSTLEVLRLVDYLHERQARSIAGEMMNADANAIATRVIELKHTTRALQSFVELTELIGREIENAQGV